MSHSKGNWGVGRPGTVVTDSVEGFETATGHIDEKYYQGKALICESIYKPDDAKLIAAAPEMLESLITILANFKSCIAGGNGELPEDKYNIEKAEAAIKKATL